MKENGTYSGRADAENLAIEALGWIAGEPEALEAFLSLAGIGPATLRRAAADPAFLAGVLDYLLGDEKRLVAFATSAGIRPERVAAARRSL